MSSTRDLLTSTYEAFNRRDIDAVLATTHPNVDWAVGVEGERLHGHEEVRAYWKRQWAMVDFEVTPIMFLGSERSEKMVVDVHQVARNRSGRIVLDQVLQHIFFIRDGLIERMDNRKADADPVPDRKN